MGNYENQKKYMAVAVANKLDIASTGTASVQIRFQTKYDLSNPHVEDVKTLWGSLYLSENTFERSMGVLSEVFGFTSDDISEINNDNHLFEGIEAVLVTDFEEYNGEMREKVKFINSTSGGVGKKIEDTEAIRLSNELRNKIKAFHMKNGTKTAPQPARQTAPAYSPAPAQEGEDDLPF